MKKILTFAFAMVCLLAFAGCGGGSQKAGAPAQTPEKVLRVGTDADYPPFEYFQEASHTFTGFDIELIQGVAKTMGYSKVEFVNREFDNLLPSLNAGQMDAVISCMTITDERKQIADFTDPYLDSATVIAGPSGAEVLGADAIKGKRIAVERGSVHEKLARAYSDKVVGCSDIAEVLKMVTGGKADFALMDTYTARFYNTNVYQGKLTIVAGTRDSAEAGIGIAVAKGNKQLLDKLNEGLRTYQTTADFMQLKNTYFGKLK